MEVQFTSYEAHEDSEDAADLYLPMNDLLSERLANRSYGSALDGSGWFLMFIFQRKGDPMPRYSERQLYLRRSAGIDFRLHVDCDAWCTADAEERRRLLYDVISRTFALLRQKQIPGVDVEALERDVEGLAIDQGWTR